MTQLSSLPASDATAADPWPPAIPRRKVMDAFPVAADEDGLADHMLAEIENDYRYDRDRRRWLVRDGDRWRPEPAGLAEVIASAAAATQVNPKLERRATQKDAQRGQGVFLSWSKESYTADEVLAQPVWRRMRTPAGQHRLAALMAGKALLDSGCVDMFVRTDELDAEPGILWAGSVPFDLARSVTHPVWAADECGQWAMTYPHMLSANYCPDIRIATPVWDRLTAAIFPDDAEREHALNALAHGLHGYPSSAAILARSATGTGKSLLASLMADMLGDYAGQVAASTLFGRSGSSQFAFDEMNGARFVVMSEGRKADFAATEAFKAVVGPDPLVNARARHERTKRLVPARHTMLLTVNPAADLDYSDPAVRRRLVPTGFAGDPEKVAAIAARYGTNSAEGWAAWEAEAPGVLAAMIVRCAYVLGDPANRGTRADAPESVMSRFDDVAAEADPFGRWFTERTADGQPTANEGLLEDYRQWCKTHHEDPVNPTWFGRAMASRGVERVKIDRGTARGWQIALK